MGMTKAIINELIVTGFGNTHTVFLARAALARVQEGLGMAVDDVAMVIRGVDGELTVQQALNRNADRNGSSAFWETLADLFFAPSSSASTDVEGTSEKCATIGIDPSFTRPIVKRLSLCESALFVRTTGPLQREKVMGVLQGFNGELMRVPLEP
jgi:uncharacterized membrane protein